MKTTSKTARKNAPKNSHKQAVTKETTMKKKPAKSIEQKHKKPAPKESHPVQDKVYALKGFKPTAKKSVVETLFNLRKEAKAGSAAAAKKAAAMLDKLGLTLLAYQRHTVHFKLRKQRA